MPKSPLSCAMCLSTLFFSVAADPEKKMELEVTIDDDASTVKQKTGKKKQNK